MKDFLIHNLTKLQNKSPQFCSLVKNIDLDKQYIVSTSKSGKPTLSKKILNGAYRTLHSKYDPVNEAVQFIKSYNSTKHSNFIVCGLGLGYHLQELVRTSTKNTKIIVIEKNPAIVKLAFIHNDFSNVINHPGVAFYIGIDPKNIEEILFDERANLVIHGYTFLNFKPLINLENNYYNSLEKEIIKTHQKFQIDINTQAAFSKKFYKNIFDNGQSIINSPGVKTLKDKFTDCPAVIVSAGPSLDKNINLIKIARNNIVILAVATALKPLLKNGIKPDFVVAIDPNEDTFQSFNVECIPSDLCLIYDPCIPATITSLFKGRSISVDSNISLAKWLSEHSEKKGSCGKVFSVAHSAFFISKIMGCNPIILVGQDLSFDGHRMHCKDSFYNQLNQDKINSARTLKLLEYYKYRKYSPSLTQVFDIFNKHSKTTRAMDSYKIHFENEMNGNRCILNATEGGVNIPGVKNLSLREALHNYCQTDNKIENINNLIKSRPSKKNNAFSKSIVKQKLIFDRILLELREIEKVYIKIENPLVNGNSFILRMKKFYKELINDAPTLHLIQGYDYLGFIEWNQRNREIIEANEKIFNDEINQKEFARDRIFLNVLIESINYLSAGFENWSKIKV